MVKIKYDRLREHILEKMSGYPGSEPFESIDRAILFKSNKEKYSSINQNSLAYHAILPNQEQLKSNLLAYVIGLACFPSIDKEGNYAENNFSNYYEIASRREIIDIVFREPVQNSYSRFRYYLRKSLELEAKNTLYGTILSKMLSNEETNEKERETFVFEGDSLGVNSHYINKYRNYEKERIENILTARMEIRETRPIWLIGIHTSWDYAFSDILYNLLDNNIIKDYVSNTPNILQKCDSIFLSCLRSGERTALFKNKNNSYILSFYCKPDFPYYSIYPLKVDIFVGKHIGKKPRDPDFIKKVDNIADKVVQLLSDPDHSMVTSNSEPSGLLIGGNRLIPISLNKAFDTLRRNMYFGGKEETNKLNRIYDDMARTP